MASNMAAAAAATAATAATNEMSTIIVVSMPRGDIYSPRTASAELTTTAVLESGEDQTGIIKVVTPRKDYTYRTTPSKFARPVQETCKFASAEFV